MLILISGGSASGKSAFAEHLVAENPQKERYYIATMKIWDRESEERVERHRNMRRDRGFVTIECPDTLEGFYPSQNATLLVEDIPNLLANCCFGDSGMDGAVARILHSIEYISKRAGTTIIVTGELASDGIDYEGETEDYLRQLATLNRAIASIAHEVWEVVAGIPIEWKGAHK